MKNFFRTNGPILLLTAASFILRVILMGKGSYDMESFGMAVNAEHTLKTGQLTFAFGTGYPLHILLGSIFQFFGKFFQIRDPFLVMNFMNVLFSTLCIPLQFFLTQKLINRNAAFFSAGLLSLNPIFLHVSVYGCGHAVALFFLLAGMCWTLRYLETGNNSFLWAGSICVGLFGACRAHDLVLMFVPLMYLFFSYRQENSQSTFRRMDGLPLKKKFILACVIALATTVLFHLPYFFQSLQSSYYGQFMRCLDIAFVKIYKGPFSQFLWLNRIFIRDGFTLVGLFAVFSGFYFLFRERKFLFWFLMIWFLCPFLFYANVNGALPRHFSIFILPMIIGQAYLLDRFFQRGGNIRRAAIIGFVLLSTLMVQYIWPVLWLRHQHSFLTEMGQWVAGKTEPDAKIIGIDFNIFLEYYGRKTLPRPTSFEELSDEDLAGFKKGLDRTLAEGTPVYFTDSGLRPYNGRQFSAFIEENYQLITVGKKLMEYWHSGGLYLHLREEHLYKVLPKS